MTKQSLLERIAVVAAVAVLVGVIWFWTLQVGNVLETLRLANGV